ncbi:cell division protein ZapE [Sediminicurvatus halobius]|uniref:Cell division protein ZapE n=1 Tax=Sediminicurvatus halobius TaxID=2182432 RepID=A0A2U2MZ37_9GAMM|nr:cell division protein ZapE [Spiribacter halobius]PWG61999.1 cell division protein ZapE [Spiribacter halobius]UEX79949.1 cell division protein ZapE [Spiribacter halobius]
MTTPQERYRADLEESGFVADAAQREAVAALQDLYERLCAAPEQPAGGLLGWWRRRRGGGPAAETGLYLWGGVGRGKTYLMDTFYECLPFRAKRRLHFHRFMRAAHQRLPQLREREDPLRLLAREWAAEVRVLCFDEFFVSDIADAMILSGLLHGLFEEGVTLVATSNVPPEDLYRDGLQRARFLPAIELLKAHTRVLNVDGGTDYRLRFLSQAEIYHTPADAPAEAALAEDFEQICPDREHERGPLWIEGRRIPVRALGDGVVWFDFSAVCEGPRSQTDYIEIARQFHTVLISGVPVFDRRREDAARRFISLVDEFYDRGVKLLLSADAPVEQLYQGRRLGFEFERTASRLIEMRAHDYLAAPHRP